MKEESQLFELMTKMYALFQIGQRNLWEVLKMAVY